MDKNKSRRLFIKKGLTTAAGIGLLSKAGTITQAEKLAAGINANVMPKRKLGKTGYDVSLFGLGGQGTIEQPGKLGESVDIINRALDLGVNYIDTAAWYGGDWGSVGTSERYIGEVMRRRRNEVFLATKSHSRTYSGVLSQFDQSLKNLRTDHIDLYQLHNIRLQSDLNTIFANNGAIHAFEKLKSEGAINFIGITGHYDPEILKKAIEQYDFDCILMSLNAADIHYLPFQHDLLDTAVKRNLGIIAMKIPSRGRIFRYDGITSMQQALWYVYSFPISTAIIGIDNLDQLEENVQLTRDFKRYNEQRMHEIEQLTAHYSRDGNWFKYEW
jgi:uncharacterized protein